MVDKFEKEKGLLDTWNGYFSFAKFRRGFILAFYQDLFNLKVVRYESPDDVGNYIDI